MLLVFIVHSLYCNQLHQYWSYIQWSQDGTVGTDWSASRLPNSACMLQIIMDTVQCWTSFITQSHTVERRVHTQHQNEQKVLIQLSNTSWELLHPGRRKKYNVIHVCVHVGLHWYKIHVKYNNNICRINTVRILHIQHTLEQCHMNNKSWGRERTWFFIWLMCLIYPWSGEFSEKMHTQLCITHAWEGNPSSCLREQNGWKRSFGWPSSHTGLTLEEYTCTTDRKSLAPTNWIVENYN